MEETSRESSTPFNKNTPQEDSSRADSGYLVESGFANAEEESFESTKKSWCPSGIKRYSKTIAAAVGLFTVGIIFLIVAIIDLGGGHATRGIAFLVVGILCGLPGGYQCYVLYKAYRRAPGFHFSQVPSWD